MSALTYCFYCKTPVNFTDAKHGHEPYTALEGDAQCTKYGAVYRMTIVQLREPERVDAPPNISDHARKATQ